MEGYDSGRMEDKRVRNRDASRRFREKKKACERKLAEENATLKDEMDLLRKKLSSTHVTPLEVITDMAGSMRGAVEHLMKGLPDALLPNIQKALAAKANASSTVTQVIKDLVHLIPPIAYAEIHMFTMSNWYESHQEGVEPTDPLLREIHRLFQHKRFRDKPVTRDQAKALVELVRSCEPRYEQAMANKTRLRHLLEEASALAAEVERDDAWYRRAVESESLRILRPEQIAARFAWLDEHMPELQDRVVGYRFDLAAPEMTSPPAQPAPAAAAGSSSSSSSGSGGNSPALAPREAPAPAPAPPPPPAEQPTFLPPVHHPAGAFEPLPSYVAAVSHPLRKRPAGSPTEPAPARPPPAAGAGALQAELLRDLIRDAVTRELTQFLDGQPGAGPGWSPEAPPGAGPAPDPAPSFLPALYGLGELPTLDVPLFSLDVGGAARGGPPGLHPSLASGFL